MDKKPIAFSAHISGRVIPCGELKPHSISIFFKDGIGAVPKCIWIDEAGLLWNISSPTEDLDLRPVEWPKDIHANYVIGYSHQYDGRKVRGSSPVTADSYEQAVKILIGRLETNKTLYEKNSFELLSVHKPFTFDRKEKVG